MVAFNNTENNPAKATIRQNTPSWGRFFQILCFSGISGYPWILQTFFFVWNIMIFQNFQVPPICSNVLIFKYHYFQKIPGTPDFFKCLVLPGTPKLSSRPAGKHPATMPGTSQLVNKTTSLPKNPPKNTVFGPLGLRLRSKSVDCNQAALSKKDKAVQIISGQNC